MECSFEFPYSFGPTHAGKIETEMILAAFNSSRIAGLNVVNNRLWRRTSQRRHSDVGRRSSLTEEMRFQFLVESVKRETHHACRAGDRPFHVVDPRKAKGGDQNEDCILRGFAITYTIARSDSSDLPLPVTRDLFAM